MIKNLTIIVFVFLTFSKSFAQNASQFLDSLQNLIECDTADVVKNCERIELFELVTLSVYPNKYGSYLDLFSRNLAKKSTTKHEIGYNVVLATKYLNNNKFDSSFEYAMKALEKARIIKDTALMVRSLVLAGALNNNFLSGNKGGLFKKDIDFTSEAYRLAKNSKSYFVRNVAITNYAFSWLKQKNFDEAKDLLTLSSNEIGKDSLSILDDVIKFHVNNLLGVSFRGKSEYELARRYFTEAEKIASNNGFYGLKFLVYLNHGINEYDQMNYKIALDYLNKSFELKSHINKNKIPVLLKLMLDTYEKQEDWQNAFEYSKKLNEVNEEIYTDEYQRKFIELQQKYEAQQKENQIKMLQFQNVQIEKEKKNISLLSLLLVVICGSLISLFLLYYYSRKKINSIVQQKELIYSMISHDLRGPVVSIHQAIPLIRRHILANNIEKTDLLMDGLNSNIINIRNLIENVLSFTKINLGKEYNSNDNVIIGDELQLVVSEFEIKTAQKKLEIIINNELKTPIMTDRIKLSSAVRNILHNAIKYSFENGQIKIDTKLGEKCIEIAVTDYGIPIDTDTENILFDSLRIQSKPGVNETLGAGIGLSISKKLINQLGGNIEYFKVSGGKKFVISIPES